ncbi:MAG: molybdopterin molybdenumtransferase MoeA, partial [Actinomycetota bacterium]|nr:molybdopterin molybdenumtransferase MoeA [Actinomycetota bacterium]
MIDLEDAQQLVVGSCPPLAAVRTALVDVVGRVLAADVVATEDVPPFPNSAVDGYAVRAADMAAVPVELLVVGEVAA